MPDRYKNHTEKYRKKNTAKRSKKVQHQPQPAKTTTLTRKATPSSLQTHSIEEHEPDETVTMMRE